MNVSLDKSYQSLVAMQAHLSWLRSHSLSSSSLSLLVEAPYISTFCEGVKSTHSRFTPRRVVVSKSSQTRPEWLSLQDLSAYSGGVTKATLRSWIHLPKNPLPATQVGNKILVRRDDFDRWMQLHAVKPQGSVDGIVADIFKRVVR